MKAIKTLLAVSVLAAAGATQAATIATFNPVTETGSSSVHTQHSSGTATLDDSGVLTITTTGIFNDSVGLGVNDSLNITEIYNGTISGTTWTASGTGTYQFSNCQIISGPNFCGLIPTGQLTMNSVSGSLDYSNLTAQSITGSVTMTVAGGPVVVNVTDTLTPVAPAVPVPAAAWLFGSGLLGLAGTARRRNA